MAEQPEILLVEDEPALRELMKVTLGSEYRYCEADDLGEALELVRERAPAVVLLDVMLPGGSGLDVLREVRANPELAHVRVAAVVGVIFLVVLLAVASLRRSADREARSKDVTAATLTLQTLAGDVETGVRGYVLTARPQFLQAYKTARATWPAAAARLERL